MKHLLVTLSLLCSACCAHLSTHTPPTEGYFGRVREGKPVYCMTGPHTAALDPTQCRIVEDTVAKVNRAVGHELLHYVGWLYVRDPAHIPRETDDLILVGTAKLPGNVVGLTVPRAQDAEGYLLGTVILMDPYAWNTHADYILLHEMTHALGVGHADKDGAFNSIMKPMDQPGMPAQYTAGDLATLRSAYN